MNTVTVIASNKVDFIKEVNKVRLNNKNRWYVINGVVEGKSVTIKAFGTWIQVMNVNGTVGGSAMDIKVGEFKKFIEDSI